MNIKFRTVDKIRINRKFYCPVLQFEAKFINLIVNLSENNLTNINNYILYVYIDQKTRMEMSEDDINPDQKIDFMYIAWFWIKNSSIKDLIQIWNNYLLLYRLL